MKSKNQSSGGEENSTVYQCTMKCEGDKVYNNLGNCPVCNMKLVPVDDKSADGHHHQKC